MTTALKSIADSNPANEAADMDAATRPRFPNKKSAPIRAISGIIPIRRLVREPLAFALPRQPVKPLFAKAHSSSITPNQDQSGSFANPAPLRLGIGNVLFRAALFSKEIKANQSKSKEFKPKIFLWMTRLRAGPPALFNVLTFLTFQRSDLPHREMLARPRMQPPVTHGNYSTCLKNFLCKPFANCLISPRLGAAFTRENQTALPINEAWRAGSRIMWRPEASGLG